MVELLPVPGVIDAEEIDAVSRSWVAATSEWPGSWSVDNPSHGQCAGTALVVQDMGGGDILCGKVEGNLHYWNLLGNGVEIDMTLQQYGPDAAYDDGPATMVRREQLLAVAHVEERYTRLKQRVKNRLFVTMFLNVQADLNADDEDDE